MQPNSYGSSTDGVLHLAAGDDAIAITGHFSVVAATAPEDRALILVQARGNLPAGKGDLIRVYGTDISDLGTAVLEDVSEGCNPLPPGTRIEPWGCCTDGQCFTKVGCMYTCPGACLIFMKTCPFFQIKLDMHVCQPWALQFCIMQVCVEEWPEAWSRAGLGCAASYPGWCGSGFQAVGNRISNTRGRGVLCKASNALIADNSFSHLKGGGLSLMPYNWAGDF
jgi:hypothetical protein